MIESKFNDRNSRPLGDPGLSFAQAANAAYIHVPFCAARCGYCNFALVADRDHLIESYLACLRKEIESYVKGYDSKPELATLFLGGGTPTHLSNEQIASLFDIVSEFFEFSSAAEISIEANPNDLKESHWQQWPESINRISIGAQSFDSAKLAKLERTHRAHDIRAAVEFAKSHQVSVSMDLIFGVAGESERSWNRDLEQALALPIDHLSTYNLTIEKGTSFGSRDLKGECMEADEAIAASCYQLAMEKTKEKGFGHYEVSNFSKPDQECRHNQAYWNLQPYFAFGPGAASFDGRSRRRNHLSVTEYLKRVRSNISPVHFEERLTDDLLARERLIFGMRQIKGIQHQDFERKTRVSVEKLVGSETIGRLVEAGLIENDSMGIRLTVNGILVSDSIWVEFL